MSNKHLIEEIVWSGTRNFRQKYERVGVIVVTQDDMLMMEYPEKAMDTIIDDLKLRAKELAVEVSFILTKPINDPDKFLILWTQTDPPAILKDA